MGTQRAPPGGKGSPVTEGRARLKRYMLVPLPVAVTQHRAGSAPVPRLGWASLISSAITTRHRRGHCPLALACSALRHSSPRSPKTPTAAEPGAPPRALAPAFLTPGSHPAGFASRWAALAPPAWCGLAGGEGSSVCEVSCGRPAPPPLREAQTPKVQEEGKSRQGSMRHTHHPIQTPPSTPGAPGVIHFLAQSVSQPVLGRMDGQPPGRQLPPVP